MASVGRGGERLTSRRGSAASLFAVVVVLSLACQSLAGQGYTTSVYEGKITSIRIDKCGLQPGLCEGSIILASPGGGDTAVDLRVGTWIKRDEHFLTIESLKVGDQVKAQTFRIPGEANPRAAILEFKNP
jgi:hypothetical protein